MTAQRSSLTTASDESESIGIRDRQIKILSSPATWDRDRWATLAFTAYAVAIFLFLSFGYPAEDRYFFFDDWDPFVDPLEIKSIFYEHNSHWYAGPFFLFRALYHIFGITTFLPYAMVAAAIHISVASLLRVAMRRCHVGAWTSAVVAGSFVLFSAAGLSLLWLSFEYSMVAAMSLGMGQLLLATMSSKSWTVRDTLALTLGLLALAFSSVALALVAGTGVAVLVKRGLRPALFHTVPLLTVWFSFQIAFSPVNEELPYLSGLPSWLAQQLAEATVAINGGILPGAVCGGAALIGLVLLTRRLGPARFLRRHAEAIGLGVSMLVFSGGTWLTRSAAFPDPKVERYIYIVAALMLPLMGIGLYELIRRQRWAVVALMPMVLSGPLHANQLANSQGFSVLAKDAQTYLPASVVWPEAQDLPAWIVPDRGHPSQPNRLTLGFLRSASAEGKLPEPPELTAALESELQLRLGTQPIDPTWTESAGRCRTLSVGESMILAPKVGDAILYEPQSDADAGSGVVMTNVDATGAGKTRFGTLPGIPGSVGFLLSGLNVRIEPGWVNLDDVRPPVSVRICRAAVKDGVLSSSRE